MILKRSDTWWNGLFISSLVILITVRWQYQISTELDVDTSTWISSAISTAQSEHPLWTLLNFSDSRPLAVLPLAIVEMAGVKVDWALADGIGVLLWVVTLIFVFLIFKNWFSSAKSLLFTAPLLLFQTAHLWPGFMTYNSEHLCILMLTVGFWGIMKIQERVHSPWVYLLLGFWLGLLPFAKFQVIPMGLVLALFVGFFLMNAKQWIRLAIINTTISRHSGMTTSGIITIILFLPFIQNSMSATVSVLLPWGGLYSDLSPLAFFG